MFVDVYILLIVYFMIDLGGDMEFHSWGRDTYTTHTSLLIKHSIIFQDWIINLLSKETAKY